MAATSPEMAEGMAAFKEHLPLTSRDCVERTVLTHHGRGHGCGTRGTAGGIADHRRGDPDQCPVRAGLLGEMGAEVIKVEQPEGGDFMRSIGPFAVDPDGDDYSMWWAVEGRGRKGVTLDLRRPEGQDLFRRLVSTADVVGENFRLGTLEGWNVGPDSCDPRLVWARISVFGQDGPYSDRPGLDRMGIAYGGLLAITGLSRSTPGPSRRHHLRLPDGHASPPRRCWPRSTAGTARAPGPGEGAWWTPLYGSILRILEWTIAAQDRLAMTRERQGNRLANSAPLDNYATADGRFVCIVAGSDANFKRLCRAMGRPELSDDPRWSTLHRRADEPTPSTTWWRSGWRPRRPARSKRCAWPTVCRWAWPTMPPRSSPIPT